MRKVVLLIAILTLTLFNLKQIIDSVRAEQSGSSPESGSDSRLKDAYDFLVGKGSNYGSTDAADWDSSTNNWGTYWNRVMEASAWEPEGTLTAAEVSPGYTFYAGNADRTIKTGTGTFYSNQQLTDFDDNHASDPTSEESSWTQTVSSPEVWLDNRTGLYWTNSSSATNSFPDTTHTTCDFFTTSDRGAYDGSDTDCGNAINACGTLSRDADNNAVDDTDWYLPTQKEMLQAYLNGIYNQTSASFATTSNHWSSTESSTTPTAAYRMHLSLGLSAAIGKTNSNAVKCVKRN